MATGVRLNIAESKKIRAFLDGLDPRERKSVSDLALERIAVATEADAKTKRIIRGRGKAKPVNRRLTWRTGRLGRSISTDRSGAPRRYVVGSTVKYAPVHEQGGTFKVRAHRRKNPPSKKRGGFGGGRSHAVKAHSIKFPKRPYLLPAYEFVVKIKAGRIFRQELERLRASV